MNERKVPQGRTIVRATTNKRQVVVALNSAELVYFELDLEGQLNKYQDLKALGSTVLALSVGEVPPVRQRTPYLVCLLLPSNGLLSLKKFRPLVVKTRQCASSPSTPTTHLKSSACKRSLRPLHLFALLRCSTQVLTRVSQQCWSPEWRPLAHSIGPLSAGNLRIRILGTLSSLDSFLGLFDK